MFKLLQRKLPCVRVFLFSILFSFFCFQTNAQAQYPKNDISLRISHALMGSGDYKAFVYQTRYTRHLNKFFALSADMGFLSSSNKWSDDAFMAHINSYYMLNAIASFAPIIKQKHIFRLGGGGSYAYRTEISPSMASSYSGTVDKGVFYLSEDKNDFTSEGISKKHSIGWSMMLDYTLLITRNLGAGAGLQFILYSDGDIINTIGLHAGYRF